MPSILRSAFTIVLLASVALASETAGHGDGDPNLQYKLVNFAILAAGIGFLVVKALFPAFRSQQREILDGMAQAERRAEEAAGQAAEIERRMAGLGEDVAALRDSARIEMEHEAERFNQSTQEMLQKIERSAELEISSMAKAARQELKQYSAGLALDLAKQKIQNRMNDTVQTGLVTRFISGLTPDVVEKN